MAGLIDGDDRIWAATKEQSDLMLANVLHWVRELKRLNIDGSIAANLAKEFVGPCFLTQADQVEEGEVSEEDHCYTIGRAVLDGIAAGAQEPIEIEEEEGEEDAL